MLEWDYGLKVSGCGLYLDSRVPRRLCFVSHAHSDHVGDHEQVISTAPTAALMDHRLEASPDRIVLDYEQPFDLDANTRLKLLPAGHVLGSAMIHLTRPQGTILYTGDFKLRPSLTVPSAVLECADVLLMESTYGQPHFRFPPWREVADELVDRVTTALRDGRQPIVMGYSLGKAQEITRILTDARLPVTLHGAVHAMCRVYERFGVEFGPYRRYRYEDFHGPLAVDLHERGALVAPPNVARSAFVTRFNHPCRIVLTGWALLKNSIYRYGVDHALPLSDHADFDELLELIERVRPRQIYTHHGYREFPELLRARGLDARLIRPEAQLQLFE